MIARFLLLGFMVQSPSWAADVPSGFKPLFNGKDTDGWHGWAIHEKGASPNDLARLSPEDRAKKLDAKRRRMRVQGRGLLTVEPNAISKRLEKMQKAAKSRRGRSR